MFRVRCKACQHHFTVPDDKAGRPITCPYCNNHIVIRPNSAGADASPPESPAAESPAAQPPAAEAPAAASPKPGEDEAIVLEESANPGSPPAAPQKARIVRALRVRCYKCEAQIEVSAADADKIIQCAQCGTAMKAQIPRVQAETIVSSEPMSVSSIAPDDWAANLAAAPPNFTHRHTAPREKPWGTLLAVLAGLALAGGIGYAVYHFASRGEIPSLPNEPLADRTPRLKPDDWVDPNNTTVWDSFNQAVWGNAPSSLENLEEIPAPSKLFDSETLTWYRKTDEVTRIGEANIRSIQYAFIDGRRLCEIRVDCETPYDAETFKAWLTQHYGPGQAGEGPLVTVQWRGRTSGGRPVIIEAGGKSPAFEETKFRLALEEIH